MSEAEIGADYYVRPPGIKVRISAGGVVVRVAQGEIYAALVREGEYPDYILPKGKVEPGESLEQAARREIEEEAGLSDLTLLGDLGERQRLTYERRSWSVTRYFLFRTPQVQAAPTDSQKRYTCEWFPLNRLPNLFWPEQRELLESQRGAIERLAWEE
jgi:8-oxo-dGTP pyrophosphatase MutT (NUDIX family)